MTVSPRIGEGHAMVSDSALSTTLSKYGDVKKSKGYFFKEYPSLRMGCVSLLLSRKRMPQSQV